VEASKVRLEGLKVEELSASGGVTITEHLRMRTALKYSLHRMMRRHLLLPLWNGRRKTAAVAAAAGATNPGLSEEGRDG
jgi:hypothetical protein